MNGGKGSKIRRILAAIPIDEWVKASDLEDQTGVSAHSVGALISKHLLYVVVERRKISKRGGALYEYRRLRRIGASGRFERV